MLTNQRRVYVDQSERRSSKLDQSEPSSQNAMRGTCMRVRFVCVRMTGAC